MDKKFSFAITESMRRFGDRVKTEAAARLKNSEDDIRFGIPFLDDVALGIFSEDLVVPSARTGAGKSQSAVIAAMENAKAGKRVHFFALEAAEYEIERRIKYQIFAQQFFQTGLCKRFPEIDLNYMDWYRGRYHKQLGQADQEIDLVLQDCFPNLWTFYRSRGDFTVQTFEKQLLAIQDQTDLVIVDHLHYFDLDDDNEHRGLKLVVKRISDLVNTLGKPVILISHLRKTDRKSGVIVPSEEDLHGTSDIAKIATKVVTFAPCNGLKTPKGIWPTYMRLAKNRYDMSRSRYVALAFFDASLNRYQSNYLLGRLSPGEDKMEVITTKGEMPSWAKEARTPSELDFDL